MQVDSTEPEYSSEQRLGAVLMGIFLMCFGMPFTLVPMMIVPGSFGAGSVFVPMFLICFSIPFVLAGLAVQYAGLNALRFGLFPNSEKAREALKNGTMFASTGEETDTSEVNGHQPATLAEKTSETLQHLEALTQHEPEPQSTNFWDSVETKSP